jgi:hypothetical protein
MSEWLVIAYVASIVGGAKLWRLLHVGRWLGRQLRSDHHG